MASTSTNVNSGTGSNRNESTSEDEDDCVILSDSSQQEQNNNGNDGLQSQSASESDDADADAASTHEEPQNLKALCDKLELSISYFLAADTSHGVRTLLQLQSDNETLDLKCTEYKKQHDDLLSKSKSSDEIIANLKNELQAITEQHNEDISSLTNQLKIAESTNAELENCKTESIAKLNELHSTNLELKVDIEKEKFEKTQCHNALRNFQRKIEEAKAQEKKLNDKNLILHSSIEQMNTELANQRRIAEDCKNDYNEILQKNASLLVQLEAEQIQRKKAEELKSDEQRVVQEITKRYNVPYEEHQQEIMSWNKMRSDLVTQIQTLQDQLNKQQASDNSNQIKKHKEEIEKLVASLEFEKKQYNQLREETDNKIDSLNIALNVERKKFTDLSIQRHIYGLDQNLEKDKKILQLETERDALKMLNQNLKNDVEKERRNSMSPSPATYQPPGRPGSNSRAEQLIEEMVLQREQQKRDFEKEVHRLIDIEKGLHRQLENAKKKNADLNRTIENLKEEMQNLLLPSREPTPPGEVSLSKFNADLIEKQRSEIDDLKIELKTVKDESAKSKTEYLETIVKLQSEKSASDNHGKFLERELKVAHRNLKDALALKSLGDRRSMTPEDKHNTSTNGTGGNVNAVDLDKYKALHKKYSDLYYKNKDECAVYDQLIENFRKKVQDLEVCRNKLKAKVEDLEHKAGAQGKMLEEIEKSKKELQILLQKKADHFNQLKNDNKKLTEEKKLLRRKLRRAEIRQAGNLEQGELSSTSSEDQLSTPEALSDVEVDENAKKNNKQDQESNEITKNNKATGIKRSHNDVHKEPGANESGSDSSSSTDWDASPDRKLSRTHILKDGYKFPAKPSESTTAATALNSNGMNGSKETQKAVKESAAKSCLPAGEMTCLGRLPSIPSTSNNSKEKKSLSTSAKIPVVIPQHLYHLSDDEQDSSPTDDDEGAVSSE